jgi:hypothetical protein
MDRNSITLADGRTFETETAFARSLGLFWIDWKAARNAGQSNEDIAANPVRLFPPMTCKQRYAVGLALQRGKKSKPGMPLDYYVRGREAGPFTTAAPAAKPAPSPSPPVATPVLAEPLSRAEAVRSMLRKGLLKAPQHV